MSAGAGDGLARRARRAGMAGFGAAALTLRARGAGAGAMASGGSERRLALVASEREAVLLGPGRPASRVWSFGEEFLPVVRMRRGERLVASLENRLAEHTTIHWHGVRVPNAQDGVPYVTQPPVEPGQSFTYDFVPPDTGTFFFHPHCNTIVQLGRGLAGVLVVEGDETRPYDADLVLALKDWRLAEDGGWLPFTSPAAAARAGTFGTVRTVNAQIAPRIPVPAGGDIRLRILNLDPTRIGQLGIESAEAAVVAIDGMGLSPFPLDTWRLGPAMRIDVVIRAPAPGETATLVDYFAPEPVTLATLVGAGQPPARRRKGFDPAPLLRNDLPVPEVKSAEKLRFAFASASGGLARIAAEGDALATALLDSLCTAEVTNWSINKRSWASRDHANLPAPLAELAVGLSYVAELSNETPHPHPIHMHGMMFRVLGSSTRKLPDCYCDTVLLTPKERLTIAFRPDAPGDWMFHCHLIEHQETGMMGFLRVRG